MYRVNKNSWGASTQAWGASTQVWGAWGASTIGLLNIPLVATLIEHDESARSVLQILKGISSFPQI